MFAKIFNFCRQLQYGFSSDMSDLTNLITHPHLQVEVDNIRDNFLKVN